MHDDVEETPGCAPAHADRRVIRDTVSTRIAKLGAPFLAIAGICGGVEGATLPNPSTGDLADLTLEELGNLEITSVSRHAERLSAAPASIFVITSEDIRRSGATSLPDVLRLAPNLQVARINASQYAISARGFNNSIGNKLLVLIDGRTVYTPLFSGVNWDSQFVMLEDIERIEVISGPGATLWGANAVNGVINVITRSAQQTQGALVSAGVGNMDTTAAARHGGRIGGDGFFRVYAVGADRDNTRLANGSPVADAWKNAQGGFRADWISADRSATVQGDAYEARMQSGALGAPRARGANLLARWTQKLENGSDFEVQSYYDYTSRDDPFTLSDSVDLFDIEFQHAFRPAAGHRLLWGGGWRYARDSTETHFNSLNRLPQVYVPANKTLDWGNVFVQDEVALSPALNLTLGLKVETNVYTDVEYLPSARLAWTPGHDQLLWGALSRAVRAPARIDREFQLFVQLPNRPLIPIIKGGPDFQSEVADVLEIGYRAQPNGIASYSITGFYSFYDKLRSGSPPPAFVQNMMQGSTYGVEAWGSLQATRDWRLSAGVVGLGENLRIKAGSLDPTGPSALGNDPKWQWMVRSSLNVTSDVDFDVGVRHVGKLPNPVVPDYTAVDARLGWRPTPGLELSLALGNLSDPYHPEFGPPASRSELGRQVFAKVSWRY